MGNNNDLSTHIPSWKFHDENVNQANSNLSYNEYIHIKVAL